MVIAGGVTAVAGMAQNHHNARVPMLSSRDKSRYNSLAENKTNLE
jgi:hypothetical protein